MIIDSSQEFKISFLSYPEIPYARFVAHDFFFSSEYYGVYQDVYQSEVSPKVKKN